MIATQMRPILKEIEALASKAKDQHKPVGPQLTPLDNERFGELSQRLKALQAKEFVESVYQEHIDLIAAMAQALDTEYRWGQAPSKDDPYALADSAPFLMQHLDPITENTTPKGTHCTMGWALTSLEAQSVKNVDSRETASMLREFSDLQAKYGVKNLDEAAMTPKDKATYGELRPKLVQAKTDLDNIGLVEQLKLLADAAQLIYKADIQDLANSMGDYHTIGRTLQAMRASGQITAQMAARIGLWNRLDDKYPCQAYKNAEESAKMRKAMGLN